MQKRLQPESDQNTEQSAPGVSGHTPGPWERGGLTRDRYVTEGSTSEGIFELGDVYIFPPLGEAGPVAIAAGIGNADRIVRACNSHDTLVKALEFIRDGYDRLDVSHEDFRVKAYAVALDALDELAQFNSHSEPSS